MTIVGDGTLMRSFSHLKLMDKGRKGGRKENKVGTMEGRENRMERKEEGRNEGREMTGR